MRRHELDVVSLLSGLLFVLVAAGFLVAEASDRRLDPEWVGPGILVALGVVGLVAVSLGARDGSVDGAGGRPAEPTTEPTEPSAEPSTEPVDGSGGTTG